MTDRSIVRPISSDNKFEALLEAAPVAIVITDENGIIRHSNRQAVMLFGYERAILVGQSIEILTYQKSHTDLLSKVVTSRQSEWRELTIQRKDGTQFVAEVSFSPMEMGEELLISASFRDISANKDHLRKLNSELSESKSIYQTIASSIPGSLIVLFDTDYRYILIEGDLMPRLGYSKEKLLHKKAIDVLPPDVFQGVKIRLDRVFSGEFYTMETHVTDVDIVTRYVPIRNEQQEVSLAMVVIIDVTELKNSQRALADLNSNLEQKVKERTQELQQVNSELESFTYSVSHDLRAPLRIIDGFADMVLQDYKASFDEEGMRLLQVIKGNARRMGQLIDDLLNLSRYNRKEIVMTPVNMQGVVEEVIEEQRLLAVKPAEITCDALPPVVCDRNLIHQVWVNLISNALKYSAKRSLPRIHISAEKRSNEVVYSIKDNGVGFDMLYVDKLFGVFQRLHKPTEYEGTGVGLALVHRIITRHGGTIWADAVPDEGANFHFTLPLHYYRK